MLGVILAAGIIHLLQGEVGCTGLAGPNQIDLESEKAITVCTSQKRSLTCGSPGSSIAITDVFWGRQSRDICPSDDGDEHVDCGAAKETPGIVRGMCQGKAACQLEAKHKLLQNPESRHCP
ncbi:Rhamnose-binding lectin, partial [Paramuricea clavata]